MYRLKKENKNLPKTSFFLFANKIQTYIPQISFASIIICLYICIIKSSLSHEINKIPTIIPEHKRITFLRNWIPMILRFLDIFYFTTFNFCPLNAFFCISVPRNRNDDHPPPHLRTLNASFKHL